MSARAAQRVGSITAHGLSMVELLVGIAIAMVVLTGALKLYVDHLRHTQAGLRDLRLLQDMRAVVDLWRADLRHAGHWGATIDNLTTDGGLPPNPHGVTSPIDSPSSRVTYTWSDERETPPDASRYGFDLQGGAVRFLRGTGGWQALTDTKAVVVTQFVVTPHAHVHSLGHLCTPTCGLDQPDCPRIHALQMHLHIKAHPYGTSPANSRAMQSTLHLPNHTTSPARCPAP